MFVELLMWAFPHSLHLYLKSNFLKVKCGDCENHQIIFDHAASTVKCVICGKTLVEPKGGRSKICAQIVEVLDH